VKNFIVITTINDPTEAVLAFSRLSSFQLVVVGDKKTPRGWACPNTTFLAADDPACTAFSLSRALPYNHYCRKMLGYLHAFKLKADTVVDTDDDNIPKSNWLFPPFQGAYDQVPSVSGNPRFVNIYRYYTRDHIWPRGLPLRLINDKSEVQAPLSARQTEVGVWQGLADEDPDVDAIYRLTSDVPCRFVDRAPLVLDQEVITPFNSQNTIFKKELFPLLYLPATVTFRFTDILRSLVAQPIMWLHGYRLGFTNATVVQKRNPHDYFKDFVSEIPMYEHVEKVVGLVQAALSPDATMAANLRRGYLALAANNVVKNDELSILDSWLDDMSALDT
jgi:STELLO glycosyltransferases